MNINSKTLSPEAIFHGLTTRYYVPHYQRDYSWTSDNHEELWADLLHGSSTGGKHFLGCIVLNSEGGDQDSAYEIVDGQQRLTTLTILFATARDLAKHYLSEESDGIFDAVEPLSFPNTQDAERVRDKANQCVRHVTEPDNYYLRLNDKDHLVFHEKIQDSDQATFPLDRSTYKAEPRTLKARKFFAKNLIEEFATRPDCFVALNDFVTYCITRVLLLRITVTSDTDAYLLFETLNDRGMDLSISDLVKNRLLMCCGEDAAKRDEVLSLWDELVDKLEGSRFPTHEFLRLYWCAFQESCTKKELYKKIKEHLLSLSDVPSEVRRWIRSADFFAEITAKELRFPDTAFAIGSLQARYAELNTLRYSVYLPLFLRLNHDRPALLEPLAEIAISYLFRLITVGRFSAREAESAFNRAIDRVKDNKDDEEVIACFVDNPETSSVKLSERLKTSEFEQNQTAKYILTKLHLFERGPGHPLNHTDVHLEHVMPQDKSSWPDFDKRSATRERWAYCLGNMTLLEERVNKAAKNALFTSKVDRFRPRDDQNPTSGSSIPMTNTIHQEHTASGRDWDADWILERVEHFSKQAQEVWPLALSCEVESEIEGGQI